MIGDHRASLNLESSNYLTLLLRYSSKLFPLFSVSFELSPLHFFPKKSSTCSLTALSINNIFDLEIAVFSLAKT